VFFPLWKLIHPLYFFYLWCGCATQAPRVAWFSATIGFAQSNDWYKLEKKEFGFKIDFPEKPKTKVWKADKSLDFFYETYDFHCFPDKKKATLIG
jgi:hypothetical protein